MDIDKPPASTPQPDRVPTPSSILSESLTPRTKELPLPPQRPPSQLLVEQSLPIHERRTPKLEGSGAARDNRLGRVPSPLTAPVGPSPTELSGLPSQSAMTVDEPTVTGNASHISRRASPVENQSYPLDRPLNVTDALSYLDAVKVQFQDQPDVYNQFLDIMKEFKNEQIDTPGVIKRVSQLFNGHSSLIQGFNTFLPAGYRIECSGDGFEASFITVTTPTGTTMQTTNHGSGRGPILWSTTSASSPLRHDTVAEYGTVDQNIQLVMPDPRPYTIDGEAIEPAVQYVQKIKQRCDPDTYRQFLDILSKYHHSPDAIDEAEVSRQIARLFKDAPDLRADFRVFMPDRSQQLMEERPSNRTATPTIDGKSRRKLDVVTSSANNSNVINGSSLPQKRKRKAAEKEREREKEIISTRASAATAPPASKKLKHSNNQGITPLSYNPKHVLAGPSSPHRSAHHLPPQPQARAPMPAEDGDFFDRVKRALDNRDLYNEFLKIVNLFTQDFIDTSRLIKESRSFLGDTDLLRQFKEILGWDERKEREHFLAEQQALNDWKRPQVVAMHERPGRVDLSEKYGSYRKVSASEANVPCSGRDEMCRSVLNDEWVSHPTWSGEDSGFIAHKKNIYEEALHRSEEERHEYDFHIEAIARTITMLEPINNKIAQMSPEDRGSFKLKPNLGGSWKAIHQRVIKKIYGREPGLEVIQTMQDSPALAIPVVLQRLKQKEEEWKRAQREWNKVWREVDARNYAKSLDHQAIAFKAADKKTITTKAFVSQIEAAREEQMAARACLIDPLFARTRPRHQLDFILDDMQVLQDAMKLTFSFLDRTQAQINFMDRKRIEGFLRSFTPLFFAIDSVAFNAAFIVQETVESEGSDADAGSNVDEAELSSASSSKAGRSNHHQHRKTAASTLASAGGDLRKKLLKSEQAKSTSRKTRAQDATPPSASRPVSPSLLEEEPKASGSGSNATDSAKQARKSPRRHIFFTNTTFYTLIRLIQVLVARLALFKGLSSSIASQDPQSRRQNLSAVATGLSAQSINGDQGLSSEHYYELFLESCERLFDNELEQHAFEEQMRVMFGIQHAFKSFTIDKVIGALIKQVQAVFSDSKSQDLLEVLKRERSLVSPTTQDQINTRRNAEKILGPDENVFRIDWLADSKTVTAQLIGKDDSSFDDSEVLTGRWQSYLDSYVSIDATSGVSQSKAKLPFLRRNIPASLRDLQPDVAPQDGLEIKLCVRTYKLFYVAKSEDFLWKYRNKGEMEKNFSRLKSRNAARQKWLYKTKANLI